MKWTEHPVYEVPGLARTPEGAIVATFRDGKRLMTPEQLVEFHRLREERIAQSVEDPLRYGWQPEVWKEADRLLDEYFEALILGGNRATKSTFAAKRVMVQALAKPNGRYWCFQENNENSISMQQPLLWHFMPPELRTVRKTRVTNISYGQKTGFAENSFVLPNGSQVFFRNYSQDVSTIEGGEVDGIWFDELVPPNFLETARYRLVTRNGWMLVTFTPKDGYSQVVKEYLQGAKVERDREARLLPIFGKGDGGGDTAATGENDRVVVGYERMPVVRVAADGRKRIMNFWSEDNPFGGYERLAKELEGSNRETIMLRAYGEPTKSAANQFPKFSDRVHVIPPDRVPTTGTNYHVVDPCSGRNWMMIWARFDSAGRCFIFDEWPREDRYIPGVGYPGKWAEPDGKKHDGRPGDAQRTFGFGIAEYKAEVDAIEAGERVGDGEERRAPFEVFERIMDSRYGNAATVSREGATTLIEECAEVGMDFLAAPGDSINEGLMLINDWLSYDTRKPVSALNQPKLYVSAKCTSMIYALMEWTGRDGKTGSCKDPIDVLRYLLLSGAGFVEGKDLSIRPGGAY
jgi:phage terminase large subunit-like protein